MCLIIIIFNNDNNNMYFRHNEKNANYSIRCACMNKEYYKVEFQSAWFEVGHYKLQPLPSFIGMFVVKREEGPGMKGDSCL